MRIRFVPKKRVLPKNRIVPKNEIDYSANDDSQPALKAAEHNAALLQNEWCECDNQSDLAYYRSWDKGHGWMCGKCRGIVQTG